MNILLGTLAVLLLLLLAAVLGIGAAELDIAVQKDKARCAAMAEKNPAPELEMGYSRRELSAITRKLMKQDARRVRIYGRPRG